MSALIQRLARRLQREVTRGLSRRLRRGRGWHRVGAALVVVAGAGLVLLTDSLEAASDTVSHELRGEIVRVVDGDTVRLQGESRRYYTIRLASIDAPEIGRGDRQSQPYSQASRRALDSRILGETLEARCFEIDGYGRDICELIDAGGQSINRWLVSDGWAWANQQYNGKYMRDSALPQLEEAARAAGRGLWEQPDPVAPWVWRERCWRQKQCP